MDIVIRWRTLGVVLLGAGLLALVTLSPSNADGQKDNSTDNVRPIPPKGVAVAEADVKELKAGLDELQKAIADPNPQELTKRGSGVLQLGGGGGFTIQTDAAVQVVPAQPGK